MTMLDAKSGAWIDRLSASDLDQSLPTPLYHQIYLMLQDKIRTGDLVAGAFVPGEHDLARHLSVSRITVKRALNELATAGLVTRHRGRGTIVASRPSVPVVRGSFDTLMQSLQVMGLVTEVELLDVAEVSADSNIADHLGLDPGARVQRAVRRRKLEGEPFAHLVTYIPVEIARRYSLEDLASTSLLLLLERAGSPAVQADQWITAVAAEPAIAAALDIAIGAPLLRVERVMSGDDGAPIQLIYAHYRPDRFQYHVKTHRRRTFGTPGDVWREEP